MASCIFSVRILPQFSFMVSTFLLKIQKPIKNILLLVLSNVFCKGMGYHVDAVYALFCLLKMGCLFLFDYIKYIWIKSCELKKKTVCCRNPQFFLFIKIKKKVFVFNQFTFDMIQASEAVFLQQGAAQFHCVIT